MRAFSCFGVVFVLAVAAVFPAFGGEGTVVSVSPEGPALQEALAQAGQLRQVEGTDLVSVVLSGGDYLLTAPLKAEALGKEGAPVEIIAKPDETPVIHGGVRVTGWREEGGHWVADFPAGLPAGADLSALWVNGRRATPARTPNATNEAGDFPADSDFFYTAGPVIAKAADGKEGKSNTAFQYGEGDLQAWPGLDEAVFVVFHSWETSQHRVERLDTEKREVHFKKAAVWSFTQWLPKQWYFVENLMEGLDQPGECVISPKTGKIHYLPRPGEALDSADAWVPVARQLLVLADGAGPVADITLRGLRFEHTGWGVGPEGHSDPQAAFSVPAMIDLRGAQNWKIQQCTLARGGTYGVWFGKGSAGNLLEQCEITDMGAGGVRIGEGASPETPEQAADGNTVDNCYLHDLGRVYRGAVGVWIGRSSYNRITHNEICDVRYTGVSVGWSWGYAPSSANNNLIENNHIHHIAKGQLSDTGGVYTLGLSPGTAIRGNYIHDVLSNPKISGGWGLYTDEGSTDIVLENNVVVNTETGGFHQHYGKENRVRNNIFAFSRREQLIRSREEEHISFFFENNIVYYDNGKLLGSTWKNGNFRLSNNCYWDASGKQPEFAGMSLEEWQAAGHDAGSVAADPKFADAANRDFTLADDSPVHDMGFTPLDPADAGLYGPGDWTERAKKQR